MPSKLKGDLSLRFSPTAWAKLSYLRDLGPTEVSGFGITDFEDPLYVVDFVTVKQQCTAVTTKMDPDAISEMLEDYVEAGYQPWQLQSIWIHTHPMDSARPSGTDENTFEESFDKNNWSIMFILAKGGQTSCRLKIHNPLKLKGFDESISVEVPVEIDFNSYDFEPSNHAEWEKEYKENVVEFKPKPVQRSKGNNPWTQKPKVMWGEGTPYKTAEEWYIAHGDYGENLLDNFPRTPNVPTTLSVEDLFDTDDEVDADQEDEAALQSYLRGWSDVPEMVVEDLTADELIDCFEGLQPSEQKYFVHKLQALVDTE